MSQASVVTKPVGQSSITAMPALPPRLAQAFLVVALAGGVIGGFSLADPVTAARAVQSAGPDLTRLMHFMVAIKALMVIAAASAVLWRLLSPVSLVRLLVYAGLSVSMTAGLGEMWHIAHVTRGAVMLHGGLLATVVVLWRDRALHARLAMLVARRQWLMQSVRH